jgi:hypothetical protein
MPEILGGVRQALAWTYSISGECRDNPFGAVRNTVEPPTMSRPTRVLSASFLYLDPHWIKWCCIYFQTAPRTLNAVEGRGTSPDHRPARRRSGRVLHWDQRRPGCFWTAGPERPPLGATERLSMIPAVIQMAPRLPIGGRLRPPHCSSAQFLSDAGAMSAAPAAQAVAAAAALAAAAAAPCRATPAKRPAGVSVLISRATRPIAATVTTRARRATPALPVNAPARERRGRYRQLSEYNDVG